jgi:hypothetical protein
MNKQWRNGIAAWGTMGNVSADGGDISYLPAGESIGGFLQRRGMAPDGFGLADFGDGNTGSDGEFSIIELYIPQLRQPADIQQIPALKNTSAHVDHYIGASGQNGGVRSMRLYKIEGLAETLRPYVIDIKHSVFLFRF